MFFRQYALKPFLVFILLQVNCLEAKIRRDELSTLVKPLIDSTRALESMISEIETHPQVSTRTKRSTDKDIAHDACHVLDQTDLPAAKIAVNEAWNNSTDFIIKVTDAFNRAKLCPSWNPFSAVPCMIKAALELKNSYNAYKPQITALVNEIEVATNATRQSFIGCVKILVLHDRN